MTARHDQDTSGRSIAMTMTDQQDISAAGGANGCPA